MSRTTKDRAPADGSRADAPAVVYEATEDLPRFGIQKGDRFILRVGREGVTHCRMMWSDDFSAALRAYPDALACLQGEPVEVPQVRPTRVSFLSVIAGGAR